MTDTIIENILSEISRNHDGKRVGEAVEFQTLGCDFKIWFLNPVSQPLGENSAANITAPSSFSIRCQTSGLKNPTDIFVRIRKFKDIGNDFDIMTISNILDQGFNEIDIGSGWIEIRKTNLVLSNREKFVEMSQVCSTLPQIIQPSEVV